MKKLNWFLLSMLFVLIPVLQSCDDSDGYSIGQRGRSWATVRVVSGDTYYLESDSYGSLWPAATRIYGFKPVDGKRVLVIFNPLYDDYGKYDMAIKVENIFPITTKQVEDLTLENKEEIGNDPVSILKGDIWIANGYLNLIFEQNRPVYEPHLVSLVRNTIEEAEDDGYIHLEYRYNTHNDLSGRLGYEAVSFNLNSLNFEGKKGLKLKLNSSVNGEVELAFNVKEVVFEPKIALNLDYNMLEAGKTE